SGPASLSLHDALPIWAGLESGPYKILPIMTNSITLVCDGCGQAATAEHIARRLQRLEWTTRYRPVHIHALLLGAFSPLRDEEFRSEEHTSELQSRGHL